MWHARAHHQISRGLAPLSESPRLQLNDRDMRPPTTGTLEVKEYAHVILRQEYYADLGGLRCSSGRQMWPEKTYKRDCVTSCYANFDLTCILFRACPKMRTFAIPSRRSVVNHKRISVRVVLRRNQD